MFVPGLTRSLCWNVIWSTAAESTASCINCDWATSVISFSEETILNSRSEEHTSELQSRQYLVCRLLLEKKKKKDNQPPRRAAFPPRDQSTSSLPGTTLARRVIRSESAHATGCQRKPNSERPLNAWRKTS